MLTASNLYAKIIEEITEGQIRNGLTNLILFAQLKNDKELERWARLESDGYLDTNSVLRNDDIVPKYRTIVGEYKDQHNRSLIIKDPKLHFIQEDRLRLPVVELEEMAKKEEVLAYRDPRSIQLVSKYLNVHVDKFVFSPLVIKGVLNAIKNQIIKRLEKYMAEEKVNVPTQTKMDSKQQKLSSLDNQNVYDVVLSFAGEDRQLADELNKLLKQNGFKTFYDKDKEAKSWGKYLPEYFDRVYRKEGKYCVMFISKFYKEKMWCKHERKSAIDRALREKEEYILPVRIDDTDLDGLQPTIGYLDIRTQSIGEIYEILKEKLTGQSSVSVSNISDTDSNKELQKKRQEVLSLLNNELPIKRREGRIKLDKLIDQKIPMGKDIELKLFLLVKNEDLSDDERKMSLNALLIEEVWDISESLFNLWYQPSKKCEPKLSGQISNFFADPRNVKGFKYFVPFLNDLIVRKNIKIETRRLVDMLIVYTVVLSRTELPDDDYVKTMLTTAKELQNHNDAGVQSLAKEIISKIHVTN